MQRTTVFTLIVTWLVSIAPAARAELEPGAPEAGFTMDDWVGDVPEVTDLAFLSDGRAVITRKSGEIVVALPSGKIQNARAAFIAVDRDSEKGLLGVVRDAQDRLYFYASTGKDDKNKHKVFRATVDAKGTVSVDQSRSIIGPGLEGPFNHDGGGMVIHDGQLYVGVGDTGWNSSPPVNRYGTCLNRANGKILRVNLDGTIPQDNPLVGLERVTGCSEARGAFAQVPPDKRIYAWGLRNPWRFWIDPVTGLLWIGDVGEVTQEEITVGGKGAHHGWPFYEGTLRHGAIGGLADCSKVVPARSCVLPQHSYPRSDGASVTGGLIPSAGCGWGAFEQRYFFADYSSNQVWTLDVKPDRTGAVPGSRKRFGKLEAITSMRMGPDGAMYWASWRYSAIVRVAPKSVPEGCKAAGAGKSSATSTSTTKTSTATTPANASAPAKTGTPPKKAPSPPPAVRPAAAASSRARPRATTKPAATKPPAR